MKNPLKSLFHCNNTYLKDNNVFVFEKCKIKAKFRDPFFQCNDIKDFDKIEWFVNDMLLKLYIKNKMVYKTYLNIDYDIRSTNGTSERGVSKNNCIFYDEINKSIQKTKIGGMCGVSCLELPGEKIVYLLGEKHIAFTSCPKSSIPAWVYIYAYVLSNPKWTFSVDFLLEQDVHEIVKRKSKDKRVQTKLEKMNIKKLRYVLADLCKYTTKGLDSSNPMLKRKVNEHVRVHKNDIRGILYNITTVADMLENVRKQMSEHNVSDDAYIMAKSFVDGLNDFMEVKNLDEFYIKFPWLREIIMRLSETNMKKYNRMVKLEYIRSLESFKRAHNFFDKFDIYVDTTVLLNDLYTIGYILGEDVHRIVVYAGLYHTNNTESLLTKYFNFRINWNSIRMKDVYEDNEDECCFDYNAEEEDSDSKEDNSDSDD